IVKDQIQIKAQEARQRSAASDSDNIDCLGSQNRVHRQIKGGMIHLLKRHLDLLHIRLQDCIENLRLRNSSVVKLDSLHAIQPLSHQLVQRAVKLWETALAELGGKAHGRGFTDSNLLSELRGS